MHSFQELKTLQAKLPEGWDAGDLCENCGAMAIRHRLEDLACPTISCRREDGHVHAALCWREGNFFYLDPQILAQRRLLAVMAPGEPS